VTETSFKGNGEEFMASGVGWTDIPGPGNVTKIIATNISLDPFISQSELNGDTISFKVIDMAGDFWVVEIDFDYANGPKMGKITDIVLRSVQGRSIAKTSYLNTFNNFDNNTRIDLLNQSNYDINLGIGGAYQNSSIGSPNVLVSIWIGDKNSPFEQGKTPTSPLVTYRLIIE
jgi:hypothetical protein